ncbi:MAG: hypothetical protein QT08_C0009G0031 [archaeon GW2011_AR17]|nr:MAG: hypothetical protein QT08_C0009G0031 [archaeon GW2011_AR17]MBS3154176.1 HAD-IIIA family hydrolase [Candidatus Woesearchaeota archaeon]HIH14787.1 HAD-IIIA family hydrolase [Nanoarchaeota archaeon]HIH58661.1 HAD-IIIA family hydrolase [Nanoarchaeota archaeon]HII14450.1 HAD-IIIA family hydrolase [Nanoarchaeota archaeon]
MKYIFLDRDGVINDELHFLTKKEQIKMIPKSAEAIALLNKAGYKVIVITNQPVIARGMCTEESLKEIHKEIQSILEKENAYIESFYYCPHHPTEGNSSFTKECECRKPHPGMILKAKEDFHLDNLNECYMVGDKISDIKAGNSAGCKTILVETGDGKIDKWNDAVPAYYARDLYEAVTKFILNEKKLKLFIAAGGKGERLYPLTKDIPKPMVPICGKPVLHHLVDWAKENNICEIIMLSCHFSEKIIDYFKDGREFGIKIHHSSDPYPLGSGGPLRYARKYIDDTFVYLSGDHICTVNLKNMLEFHKKNNGNITVLVHKSTHPWDSDVLQINGEKKVVKFISKHDDHTNAGDLTNSGLCIIEPEIIGFADQEKFDFETYLYPRILEADAKMLAYESDEFMSDMGTPERLKKCEDFLKSKMERVLVTGACGMMGQHLLPLLQKKGNYNILGTYFRPTTNLKELPKDIKIKELDVRDYRAVRRVIEEFKPDKILHLAAQSYPTVSMDEPQYTVDTNIRGTINLFEAVRELKLDPIILVACSSAEYGFVEEKDVPVKETHPLRPLHPYGVSKVGQDLLSYQYFKNHGMKTLRARIFNTTGPKKVNDVCSDFTKQAVMIEKGLQENKFYVGNLEARRAITDVRDMIEAFLLLMEKGEHGEVYNISGEKAYLIQDILNEIVKKTNINPEIIVDPKLLRPTDEKIIFGDNTRLKLHTGWEQKISIDQTLQDMIEYWRKVL